ncbi:MAG: transcriptional regulator NrdR [Solirubrobacterales bacterium]
MRCPFCQTPDSRVLDSRTNDDETVIRRRRECAECKKRFTTYERVEERPLMVIKRGGSREVFHRDKLVKGILRAVEKRPVTAEQVDDLVSSLEKELRYTFDREVSSEDIGKMVMDRLKYLDEVAYVRFASVYRQFTDVDGFIRTVAQLKNESDVEGENN